jgi:E3 ubiquitin-protein ligase synoviolin
MVMSLWATQKAGNFLAHLIYGFYVCVSSHIFILQVIYVQAFIFVILMGKVTGKVFFGQLRAPEFEVLS